MSESKQTEYESIEFQLAGQIAKILADYPKSVRRKALQLSAVQIDCRLIPFGIPVGTIVQTKADNSNASSSSSNSNKKGKKKTSYWKADEECKTIVSDRQKLLTQVKNLPKDDPSLKAKMDQVHKLEAQLKSRKQKLRDLGKNGSSSSTSQASTTSSEPKKGKKKV